LNIICGNISKTLANQRSDNCWYRRLFLSPKIFRSQRSNVQGYLRWRVTVTIGEPNHVNIFFRNINRHRLKTEDAAAMFPVRLQKNPVKRCFSVKSGIDSDAFYQKEQAKRQLGGYGNGKYEYFTLGSEIRK